MKSDYEELNSLIQDHGLSREEAEKSIKNCAKSMAKGALKTYAAGGVAMYFMNTNPASAFGYGSIAVGVGAGYAFLNSDQCSRVRQALDFWSKVND